MIMTFDQVFTLLTITIIEHFLGQYLASDRPGFVYYVYLLSDYPNVIWGVSVNF